jgi:hypothetical protein
LLDRTTGEKSGGVNVEHALNELKKHCRAAGVHHLETGEPGKAAAFEGLAVRFEALQNRYFARVPPRRAAESQFSERHKAEFRDLLASGVELHALNSSDSNLDFGPWRVYCTPEVDSHSEARIKARFRAAARKAAIAAGAPSRANLLDWWISRLARALPDPKAEFAFWDERVWGSFSRSIEEVASWRRERRRWVDKDRVMHVEPNDEARRRVSKRVARRTELLAAWTLGLSYDVAVLQANYIIDSGLRGEDAMRAFEHEADQLVEKVQQLWRTTATRWGLSWRKLEAQGTDLGKPFREVCADLRELIFSAFMVADAPPHNAADPAVVHRQDQEPVVAPSATIEPHHEQGGARSSLAKKAPVSDPKLRKKHESVTRYEVYKSELRALEVACKKHQTPDLLKKQFPDFEVWAVLDKDDEVDIVNGDFAPGRFAWALVKRLNGLGGKDDRTLKNYRRALKAAGIVLR